MAAAAVCPLFLYEAMTKSEIRAAVIGQGFADAQVIHQLVPGRYVNEFEAGDWYCLFVRDDAEWALWGRRRSLPELLALVERGPMFRAA